MAFYPSVIDAPDTTMVGTTLFTADDHSLNHRVLGSAVIGIENTFGTNSGTSIAKNFVAGDFAARINSSNVPQQPFNLGTFGTATLQAPTINGQGTNLGTLSGGMFGTSTWQGGTINAPQITTRTIGSAAYSGTAGGTTTLDLSTATRFLVNGPNSAGNVTLALSNVVANQPFILEYMQGTAGNGTIVFFSTIRWAGSVAPTQTFTAMRKDSFAFIPTGTVTFDGYIVGLNV